MQKVVVGIVLVSVALVCTVAAVWSGSGQKAEDLHLSAQQWRVDVQFLARELPKRHLNAFHFASRERFEKAIGDLDAQLSGPADEMLELIRQRKPEKRVIDLRQNHGGDYTF